jgi:hypothetical protein
VIDEASPSEDERAAQAFLKNYVPPDGDGDEQAIGE